MKSMRCTKTATPAAGIGQQNRPDSYSQQHQAAIILHNNALLHNTQPILQKLNELGCQVLPHLPYSPDLLPTDYHFKHLDKFLQGKCFHNQQETENAFQVFTESWSMDFCTTEINQLISYWKKRVDYNGSYFD